MHKKTLKNSIENLFNVVFNDTRQMSVSDREKYYAELNNLISRKIVELKRQQFEVERGEHIEGLYDINPRGSYVLSNFQKCGF